MSVVRSLTFGPTVSQFILDSHRVKLISGPVGSGKTIGLINFLLMIAAMQQPSPLNGKRYTRFAVCRYTLQALKNTVLKDMMQFFEGFAIYKVSESAVYIRTGDIDCEILLFPLETPEDRKRLLSTQMTVIMFNEFADIDPGLMVDALGRCGRYPSGDRGTPTWSGVIGDTNPGLKNSVWYDKLTNNLPDTWSYYQQPPALLEDGSPNPDAENMDNLNKLVPGYYQELYAAATPAWAERYIFSRWGDDLSGTPVYKSTFSTDFHVAKIPKDGSPPLRPVRGRVLLGGLDTGRNPAVVLGQIDEIGRLLIVGECWGEMMGLEKFIKEILCPLIYGERYMGMPLALVTDPQARARSEWSENAILTLIRQAGFTAELATTNSIEPRIKAVEHWLLQQRSAGPAFLIDPQHAPRTLKGLQGEYKYKEKRDGTVEDKPTKEHPVSDLADGLQYLCLGTQQNIYGRIMRARNTTVETPPSVDAWT